MIQALRTNLKDDPRLARLFKGGLSGVVAKGTAVLVNAISLPITVRYLGPEQYGFWVTISTTIVMFSVLDLGIANTLTNCISRAFAESDHEMAKRYYATAFWTTSLIAILLGTLGAVTWHYIDWGNLFRLSDPEMARDAGRCAAISFVYFLLTLPLGLANKVMGGYQRVPVANTFAMISSVLSLAGIIVVVRMHGNVVDLMAAFCAAMLTGMVLLNLWMAIFHESQARPDMTRIDMGAAREIMSHGMLFFALQMAGIIVFNSDNLIIAHFLGSSEVTPYAVTWRLVGYASVLQSLLIPALWPAFSEAYVGHELAWIRTTYRRVMRGTLLMTISAAVLLGFAGRWIIRVWAGSPAIPDSSLLWAMCCWSILYSIAVNQAALLAATQRLKLQAVCGTIAAILNLGLSIILVQRIGAIGVLLATIFSYLLLIMAPQSWEVRRILSGRYLKMKAAIPNNGLACSE